MRFIGNRKSVRKKPQGVLVATTYTGQVKILRVYKKPPKKCSAPRTICIKCQRNKIVKNSLQYEGKICIECLSSSSLLGEDVLSLK